MTEKYCVHCEVEIDYEEESIRVNDSYLCDTFCLAEHLLIHGLVALEKPGASI